MAILLAYFGIAIMIIGSGVGSVYGLTICGKAAVGAMRKNPSSLGSYMILSALPSTQGLYGFVGYFLLSGLLVEAITWLQAVAILAIGITAGVVCLLSAIRQGEVCANGIASIGDGHSVFAGTMVLAVFPELYAIISLLMVVLVNSSIS
jgi:V/A-type H+-transporting ATPase subunit K